ncbi:MAG: NUDIX domain-containing protein [Dehalococcoidia bacterium]|nr:NUDIX domain-containing protein [Dehalococcoidia bacterium]
MALNLASSLTDRVTGILIDGQRRVLLARRKRGEYPWDAPGGRMEGGENPETTLRRELLDGLGVEAQEYRHFATLETDVLDDTPATHFIFLVTRWAGEPQNKRPEAYAELRWAASQELNGLALIPLMRRGLQRVLEARAGVGAEEER